MSNKWISIGLASLISASAVASSPYENIFLRRLLPKKLFGSIPKKLNEVEPGQIMVKYTVDQAAKFEQAAIGTLGSRTTNPVIGKYGEQFVHRIQNTGWTLWKVSTTTDTRALARTLMQNESDVICAEPAFKIYPLGLPQPNDPDYSYTETDPNLSFDVNSDSGLDPFQRMWNLQDINALEGWSVSPGKYFTNRIRPNYSPKIAIIDTGCDLSHLDFINAGGTGTDISQGGQFNIAGCKFFTLGQVSTAQTAYDTNGHGTHVNGIALAAANNGAYSSSVPNGVPGVGFNANAVEYRVFDSSGDGSDADAAAAIYYAADQGIDIVNLSLGETNYSQLFQDAVTYAFQKGVAVFAAGNENGSGGGNLGPIYPGACSGAYCVTAAGPNGQTASDYYAGTGNYLQIAAPGGDVVGDLDAGTSFQIVYVWSTEMETEGDLYQESQTGSLFPPYNLDYGYLVGTSMACPHVAGAAAQYYGQHMMTRSMGYSNVKIYRALSASAQDIFGVTGGSWETNFGYGELDLNALLKNQNARAATLGSIDGIVYYDTTPLANVQVVYKTGAYTFSTTTRADGTYRFDALPPGSGYITATPFGQPKTKPTLVRAGSDTPGVDFWGGTIQSDNTAPIFGAASILPAPHTNGTITLDIWPYDTESGIDSTTIEIGTTSGGQDILTYRYLINDQPDSTYSGLKFVTGKTYYITLVIKNGAGLTTKKVLTIVW